MHGQATRAAPWPHKGSALTGRRGEVSSDPTAWSGAPAEGLAWLYKETEMKVEPQLLS